MPNYVMRFYSVYSDLIVQTNDAGKKFSKIQKLQNLQSLCDLHMDVGAMTVVVLLLYNLGSLLKYTSVQNLHIEYFIFRNIFKQD